MGTGRGKSCKGGRARGRAKKKAFFRSRATKNFKRMPDQIFEDLKKEIQVGARAMPQRAYDEDVPGCGQFYCTACARHFMDGDALERHLKTKAHKKQLKLMKEEPYTQAEADAAAGLTAATYPKRNI